MNLKTYRILGVLPVFFLILLLHGPLSLRAATYYVKSFQAGAFDTPGVDGKMLHTFKRGDSVNGPDLRVIYKVAEKLGVAITEVMKYTVNEIKGLVTDLELQDEEGALTGAEKADRILPGQELRESEGWLQVTWDGGEGWMRKTTLSPKPIKEKVVYQKPEEDQDKEKTINFRMRVHQIAQGNNAQDGDAEIEFDLNKPNEKLLQIMEKYGSDEENSVYFLLSEDS